MLRAPILITLSIVLAHSAASQRRSYVELSILGSEPVRIESPTLLPKAPSGKTWRDLEFYKNKQYLQNPLLRRLQHAASEGALKIPSFEQDLRFHQSRSGQAPSGPPPTLEASYHRCVTSLVESEVSRGYEGSVEMSAILCAYGIPSGRPSSLVEPPPYLIARGSETQVITLERLNGQSDQQARLLLAQVESYATGREVSDIVSTNPQAQAVISKMCLPENGYSSPSCRSPHECIYSNSPACLKCKGHRGEQGEPLVDVMLHLKLDSKRAYDLHSFMASVPRPPATSGQLGILPSQSPPPAAVSESEMRRRLRTISEQNPLQQTRRPPVLIDFVPVLNDKKELVSVCAKCPKGTTHDGRNDCIDSNGCSVFSQEFKEGRCQERCEERHQKSPFFGAPSGCDSCKEACETAVENLDLLREQVQRTVPPLPSGAVAEGQGRGYGTGGFGQQNQSVLGMLDSRFYLDFSRLDPARVSVIKRNLISQLDSEIDKRESLIERRPKGGASLCESSPEITRQQCELPQNLSSLPELLRHFQSDLCKTGEVLGHSLSVPVCVPRVCSECLNRTAPSASNLPLIPTCSAVELREAFWNVASDLALRKEAMLRVCLAQNDDRVCAGSAIPSARDLAIWLKSRGNNCANSLLEPPRRPKKESEAEEGVAEGNG